MHMLIRILVFAKDSESALNAAHEVVHEKMGNTSTGGPFDYYVDFTEDGLIITGKDRWGPIPPVLQVSTTRFPTDDKRGLEMANSAMENNRRVFKESIALIRHHIANYTDDQLFDEVEGKGWIEIEGVKLFDDPGRFRVCCGSAYGDVKGTACLYDFRGFTISSPNILQRILNDSDSNPWYMDESEGQDPNWGPHIWNQPLWIVPFDAHC